MSLKGISTSFIGTAKGAAITADIYTNKCLSQLRSHIVKHHVSGECIFWLDLGSAHYANETTKWLLQQKIKFVAEQVNLANVHKAQPIEDFWPILADKVDKGGREARKELQLKKKIKQIDMKVVQHMMTSIRRKLRKIKD